MEDKVIKYCECGCRGIPKEGNRYIYHHNWRGIKNHKLGCTCFACKAKRGEPRKFKRKKKELSASVLCVCGCGELTKPGNRYIHGHYNKKPVVVFESHLCECGCGEYAKPGNKYIIGHNTRGKPLNHKPGCVCGVCRAKRGEQPQHPEGCTCLFCQCVRGELVGEKNPFYGKTHSVETIQKNREAHEDYIPSEETRRLISLSQTGEKHWNWQGGSSLNPYPFNFNDELRELIRKRDNYTCQLCGEVWDESERKFPVHHIDYNKDNCDPSNLITLCRSCHAKVNKNRKYWTKYFQDLLKLREAI